MPSRRYAAQPDLRQRAGPQAGGVGVEGHHHEAPHLSDDLLREYGDMAEQPDRKPKAIKKMTKAQQSERPKETARQLGADESGQAFDRVLHVMLKGKYHK